MLRGFLTLYFCLFFASFPISANTAGLENGIFAAARLLHETAEDQPEDQKIETLRSVRSLLDKIVSDHPETDLAVRILLLDTIDGIDVAELDRTLAAHNDQANREGNENSGTSDQLTNDTQLDEEQTDTASLSTEPALQSEGTQSGTETDLYEPRALISNSATENALNLTRNDIRDIQARLLVLGFDPNGIDGAIGQGTRGAISAWQASLGANQSGFMSAEFLDLLKANSEPSLAVWLEDEENAKLHAPPVIALGPGNMAGRWSYVSNCGANSKLGKVRITGAISMSHSGGPNYSGTLTNSLGSRGSVRATLRGRSISSITNFGFLLGKVKFSGRVDEQQLVIRGRDSNGCSFYASK